MPQSENKPAWMDGEKDRADEQTKTGETANSNAPQLERVTRAPARKQKAFYIQEKHAEAFEKLVFDLRKEGVKAPELAEQAIELLLKKHKRGL